jgi:hypothetical protein
MSKSSKTRASRNPAGSLKVTAARIVALSEKVADAGLPDDQLDRLEDELDTLVERGIRAREDGVLNEALRTVFARNADAAEFLSEKLEEAATIVGVATVGPDGLHGTGELRLFAIPVISGKVGGLGQNFRLHRGNGLLDDFAKSFKRFGLVSASDTVAVPGYLYHPHELDAWTWSETRAVLTDAIAGVTGVRPVRTPPGRFGWPPPAPTPTGALLVELRYLLVAVMACEPEFQPFTPFQLTQDDLYGVPATQSPTAPDEYSEEDEEAEDKRMAEQGDQYYALTREWAEHVTPIVAQMLGATAAELELAGESVSVDNPDDFFEAYRQGLSAYGDVGLEVTLRSGLKTEGLLPVETCAAAAAYFDEIDNTWQVRVSVLREDGSLLLGAIRKIWPFEDIDEVLAAVAASLESMRFAGVITLPEAVPFNGADPDTFITPDGSALPAPPAPGPVAGALFNNFANDPSFKGH